jgi:hypothetical protein
MDFNSFADAFADPADLKVNLEGDKDVKPEITRDNFFYFDTLVFQVAFVILVINDFNSVRSLTQVETTLFRVPRYGFEVEGTLFQTLFSLPGPLENGEQAEGRDDNYPIVLENITKEHFRGFLRVMYPL